MRKKHSPDPFVQRLVELTFAPLDTTTDWLARIGLDIVRREAGVTTVKNPHLGLTTALTASSDPITRAVCLGFATAGVHWPRLYPGLLEAVNREWQRRLKQPQPGDADGQTASRLDKDYYPPPPALRAEPAPPPIRGAGFVLRLSPKGDEACPATEGLVEGATALTFTELFRKNSRSKGREKL